MSMTLSPDAALGVRPRPGPAPRGHEAAGDRPARGDGGGLRGRRPPRGGPGPPRVRPGRGGGVAGRRAGRLVRRHRPVPPPARAADPPHRRHPRAEGPVRPDAGPLRAGEPAHPGADHRPGAQRPDRRPGWPTGWPTRSTPPCWPATSPTPPTAWPGSSRRTTSSGSSRKGCRRAVDRVDPAAAGRQGAHRSMVAAGYHQEAFNAVLRGTARFLDEHRRRPAGPVPGRSRRGGGPGPSTGGSSPASSTARSTCSRRSPPTPTIPLRDEVDSRSGGR